MLLGDYEVLGLNCRKKLQLSNAAHHPSPPNLKFVLMERL